MAEQGAVACGARGLIAVAAAAFLLALALFSGLELSGPAESFRLGLPHVAAALLFSAMAALAAGLHEVSDRTAQDMALASRAVEEPARLADELTDIIAKTQTC